MFFRQFYDQSLAQASYLIGCQATGDAIVVDPLRDVAPYLDVARREGLRITAVTETHIHADFVSGARELAAATGATLMLSAEGGEDWQYAYAAADGARLLRDGDEIMVGNIRFEVMHTPGHTPEHLSFVVTDTPAAAGPMGILTGDFVFVGDVGRPDLLEKAAHVANTMEAGARTLFRSLARFRALPDHLQVWPGHGAGSACGKALGAVPSSTVGYEKRANWGVAQTDEDAFVAAVLEGQPEPPRYFAEMKRINRDGPAVLGARPLPPRCDPATLAARAAEGAWIVDLRPAPAYAAAHVPGTLSIPLNRSFTTWAGWLLPYDADVFLLTDGVDVGDAAPSPIAEAVRALQSIGLDRIAGWFGDDAFAAWERGGNAFAVTEQVTPDEVAPALADGRVTVVDVRGASEWSAGHLPGAVHVPLGYLAEELATLDRTRPLVLQCQSGARSAIATSVLRRLGVTDIRNLVGGFARWRGEGRPVETGDPAVTVET